MIFFTSYLHFWSLRYLLVWFPINLSRGVATDFRQRVDSSGWKSSIGVSRCIYRVAKKRYMYQGICQLVGKRCELLCVM